MKKVIVIVFGVLMFWSATAIALPIFNTEYSPASSIPEPASMMLLGFGMIGLASLGRKALNK
jgi:hypothetical protein